MLEETEPGRPRDCSHNKIVIERYVIMTDTSPGRTVHGEKRGKEGARERGTERMVS